MHTNGVKNSGATASRPLIDRNTGAEAERYEFSGFRKRTRAVLVSVVLAAALLSGIVFISSDSQAYTPHDPILIDGDSGFLPANGVVGGTGSAGDPYEISGWIIQAGTANGIHVRNTNAHYVIHNVSIWHDTYNYNNYYGIYLDNAPNGRVENSSVTGWVKTGVYVRASTYIQVQYNNLSVSASPGNDRRGIDFEGCHGNVYAVRNNVSESNYGIRAYYSSGIEIHENNLTNTQKSSIVLMSSSWVNMSGNDMIQGGVAVWGGSLSEFVTHSIPGDNMVNGKPVYYAKESSGLVIDDPDLGQVILADCEDTDVSGIDFGDVGIGVSLAFCNDTRVDDCDMEGMAWYAVSSVACENTTVTNTNMHEGEWGVYAYTGSYLTISNSQIVNNSNRGVYIYLVSKVTITNCNVSGNTRTGLAAGIAYQANTPAEDMDSYISYNIIRDNDLGIGLSNVGGVHIDHNDFVDNLVHATDTAGSENYWDDGIEGNYWDNYTGEDVLDPIGIGDDPLIIDGDSWDDYPLMEYQVIPEFADLVVPVAATILIFGLVGLRGRRNSQS